MRKRNFDYEYHTANSALVSSSSRRIGEQQLSGRTRVGSVAPAINNGAGCNENEIAAAAREKSFLDSPLS